MFLDFYGTLVAEDDEAVSAIVKAIAAVSPISHDAHEIGHHWYTEYQRLCAAAYGDAFKTQREIDILSLEYILRRYEAPLDVEALAAHQFTYWRAPKILEDGHWLVTNVNLPVCIASNIDTDDLDAAITSAGWQFAHTLTSEACRSYKPRPEIFLAALERMQIAPSEVLHVGDSLTNDVVGAQQLGIDTAWINRKGKPLPDGIRPTYCVSDLRELMPTIGFTP